MKTSQILVCLFALAARSVLAATDDEQFCSCSGDPCCSLTEGNFNIDQSLSTGDVADEVVSELYGNFSKVYVFDNVEKRTINLFGFAPVDCTASVAKVFETGGSTTPLAEIALAQLSVSSCQVNFSLTMSESQLRLDHTLFIGFREMNDPLTSVDLVITQLEETVPYTLPSHSWIVETNLVDNDVVDVTLNIQINANSGHNASCLAESNAAGMKFQFIPAGSAPRDQSECIFTVDEVEVITEDDTVRLLLNFMQQDYTACYRAEEEIGNLVRFTYEVEPAIDGCNDYYDTYQSHIFTISLDRELNVNSTGTVNSMILNYRDDTLAIVPCGAELPGFNPLVPLARLEFILEVTTAYGVEASSMVFVRKQIEDLNLDVIGDINYTTIAGSNSLISARLRTTECLLVNTQHSGSPASQDNLVSCSIDYLPFLSIETTVTYIDNKVETNDLSGDEREIVFNGDEAACAGIVVASNDVSQEYGAELILEDLNGATSNLNLNNPIVARVRLTNVDLAESTGVSVVLSSITFDLDNEYIRTYTVNDKASQMQVDFSPYYRDASFCRFYVDSTDVCTRFHQRVVDEADYEDNRWNAFYESLWAVGPSGKFVPDGTSRKFNGCQDLTQTAVDSFVFTPSAGWVFRSFPRNTGILEARATAYLRVCTPGGTRLLREVPLKFKSNSRALQTGNEENDIVIALSNVTITSGATLNIDVVYQISTLIDEPLVVALIVIAALILVTICCWSCLGTGFLMKAYSFAEEKAEKMRR